jgi:hypothetical protein
MLVFVDVEEEADTRGEVGSYYVEVVGSERQVIGIRLLTVRIWLPRMSKAMLPNQH